MRSVVASVAFAAALLATHAASALDIPAPPTTLVNDYAGALSNADRISLENELLTDGASQQKYVVAIFRSIESESLEDFSMRLAKAWGLSSKSDTRAVLITVFLTEHKIRIEVGYGLEDKLTDVFCSRLIADTIAPEFRSGNIVGGLSDAFRAIDLEVTGQYHTVARRQLLAHDDRQSWEPSCR